MSTFAGDLEVSSKYTIASPKSERSAGISGSAGPGVMVVKYAMNVQLIRHNGRLPLAGLQL